MFTGIVEELGRVRAVTPRPPGTRLAIDSRVAADDARVGDSVAVNGVCLTVVHRDGDGLTFDVTPETLSRSTLGSLRPGDPVNLERPLTLGTSLGGHLVQGHVDGVGTVEAVERNGGGTVLRLRLPDGLVPFVVDKGSVAVDGVSLTVAAAGDGGISVALVPHTLRVTTLGDRRPGDRVNVEVDVIAKYVEALVGRNR